MQHRVGDPTLAKPQIAWQFRIVDNDTDEEILGEGYDAVQWPTGPTFDFDTYKPDLVDFISSQYGPPGLSAYQVYQSAGGTLDEADWLASLRGPSGASGIVGIPIYATAAAGAAAGTGAAVGGYFMVPSTSAWGGYDVYLNSAGTAVYQRSITGAQLAAGDSNLLSVVTQDFELPVVDGCGRLVLPSTESPSRVDMAIAALDARCLAYSESVRRRGSPTLALIDAAYNAIVLYGQSLSDGYQTLSVRSTTAKYGNVMIGTAPNYVTASAGPQGDALFHPLVEAANSGASGESPCSGVANTFKALYNRFVRQPNDASRLIVTNSLGQPGFPSSSLTPTAAPVAGTPGNVWLRIINFFAEAAANAATASATIQALAMIYIQGENDSDLNVYSQNVQTIRDAFAAQAASSFGQTTLPAMLTYQTRMGDVAPNTGVSMAQWWQALREPNWFMFGPIYHLPSYGLHLIADSYRWMGAMAGKVLYRTAVLREGWEPLGPHECVILNKGRKDNTLLIGFHVPVPPLTVAVAYNVATPTVFEDLGFALYDKTGYQAVKVKIVAPTVVQVSPVSIVDWDSAYIRYAGSEGGDAPNGAIPHYNMGNLGDSDPAVADDVYAPDETSLDGAIYNIPSLMGQPYPLDNRCVAFCISPATFTPPPPISF